MVCLLREAGEPLDEFSFKFDVPVEEGVPSCPGTDEINEIRRNAADSLWVLKVTRRRILPLTAII